MEWNTFEGWKNKGFSIIKGSKSSLREPKTNLPLFSEEQVIEVWCPAYCDATIDDIY